MFTWAGRWGRYDCLTTSVSPIAAIRFTFANSYTYQKYGQNESANDECHHQAEEDEEHFFRGSKTFVKLFVVPFEGIVKGARMNVATEFAMFIFEKVVIEKIVSHFCVWRYGNTWAALSTNKHSNTPSRQKVVEHSNNNNNTIMSRARFLYLLCVGSKNSVKLMYLVCLIRTICLIFLFVSAQKRLKIMFFE